MEPKTNKGPEEKPLTEPLTTDRRNEILIEAEKKIAEIQYLPDFREKLECVLQGLVSENKAKEALVILKKYSLSHCAILETFCKRWSYCYDEALHNTVIQPDTTEVLDYLLREGRYCAEGLNEALDNILMTCVPSDFLACFLNSKQVDLKKIIQARDVCSLDSPSPLMSLFLVRFFWNTGIQQLSPWKKYLMTDSSRALVLLIRAGISTVQYPQSQSVDDSTTTHSSDKKALWNNLYGQHLHLDAFENLFMHNHFFEARLLYETGAVSYKEVFIVWQAFLQGSFLQEDDLSDKETVSSTVATELESESVEENEEDMNSEESESDESDESDEDDINSEESLEEMEEVEQAHNQREAFLQLLISEPRSLQTLSALKMSSMLGCRKDRAQYASSLPLPRVLVRKVLMMDAIRLYATEVATNLSADAAERMNIFHEILRP